MDKIKKIGVISIDDLNLKKIGNQLNRKGTKENNQKAKFLSQFLWSPQDRKEFYKHKSKNFAVMAPLLYKEMVEQYYNSHTWVGGKKYIKRNVEPQKPFVPIKNLEKEKQRSKR